MFGSLFGDVFGVAGDPRALTQEEMYAIQVRQLRDQMQDQQHSYAYLSGMSQYWPPNQKPLDERFADFKQRLAAAVEARKRPS